ncbi:MAG: hypothetical protein J6T77_07595 [Clostridia bacterium]|nr:hypothetical protein [Clostridia bacterium]
MNGIIRRIICVLLVLAVAFALAACNSSGEENSKQEPASEQSKPAADEPTQGDINVSEYSYKNESLGLAIKLDDGWSIRSPEELLQLIGSTSFGDAIKNAPLTYDFYAVRLISTASINIIFENMKKSVGKVYTESEYLNLAKTSVKTQVEAAGLNVNKLELIKRTVAGRELNGYHIVLESGGTLVYEYIFAVRVGEYMASITLASPSMDELETLVGLFYPA